MLRFAADENFNADIIRGVLRRQPDISIVRVQDAGLSGADDAVVLEWAAHDGRVLVTHDAATMTKHAFDRVRGSLSMPGVFEVSLGVPIGRAIDDLVLIAVCSMDGEWEGQIRYLPL